MFDEYVVDAFGRAERKGLKGRLKTLPELDRAALKLRDACLIFLAPSFTELAAAREAECRRLSRDDFERALTAIGDLARPPDDRHYERVLKGYLDPGQESRGEGISPYCTVDGGAEVAGWRGPPCEAADEVLFAAAAPSVPGARPKLSERAIPTLEPEPRASEFFGRALLCPRARCGRVNRCC